MVKKKRIMQLSQQHTYRCLLASVNFSIAVGLLLSGCQTPTTSPDVPRSEANPQTSSLPTKTVIPEIADEIKATKPRKIAFILRNNYSHKYWQRMGEEAERAGQDFGVDVNVFVPEDIPKVEFVQDQILLVADLISKGEIEALILGPADSIALAPVIEKAIDRQIPVIAIDTPLDSDRLLTFIGFDNFAAGRLMGQWVVKQLGGKGKVAILEGPQHHENAIDRRNGFLEGLKTGEIEILASESANWEEAKAQKITAAWMQQFDELDAIMAANDQMAIAASQAVAEADRQGIIITGFDAVPPALEALKNKKIAATIDQVPDKQARLAIQLAIRHLENGATYPPAILWPDISIVTADNADDYLSSQ